MSSARQAALEELAALLDTLAPADSPPEHVTTRLRVETEAGTVYAVLQVEAGPEVGALMFDGFDVAKGKAPVGEWSGFAFYDLEDGGLGLLAAERDVGRVLLVQGEALRKGTKPRDVPHLRLAWSHGKRVPPAKPVRRAPRPKGRK